MRRLIYDPRMRALAFQSVLLGAIVLAAAAAVLNARQALTERGLSSGFGFLAEPAGFALSESVLPYEAQDSVAAAFLAGLANTIAVSLSAIVLATVLGVLIGLARLSPNRMLSAFAGLYVEIFRNTPQLIQVIFWYSLIIALPPLRQAVDLGGVAFLSNRGLVVPWVEGAVAGRLAAAALGCGFIIALVVLCLPGRRRWRRTAMTFAAALPVGAVGLMASHGGVSYPRLQGFNFVGGTTVSPEFLALFLGLGLYIAAFIAEIVRAGLASVDRGQTEAALALGLPDAKVLASVRIPQALRVIVPPAAAQYISLVKNSSLGVAIGYPELFNVSNSLATLTGQAIECVGIMAVLYLLTALTMSALTNGFNRMTLITER